MRIRTRLAAVLMTVFTLTAVMGVGVAHADDLGGGTTDMKPRFVTRCTFSHRLADDPIVHPGMPGASHLHDFFGNTTTNAKSTLKKLKRGTTTCKNPQDLSGYWTPSLKVNGVLVDPTQTSVYYSSNGKDYRKIKAPPRGLEVVAGNAMATAPQGKAITTWDCADDDSVPPGADVPTCPMGTVALHVNFPDCWDGVHLDSANHASHLAYSSKDHTCPADHPVSIPRIRVNVRYPTTGGATAELASGGQYSGHADFFNVWVPKELKRLVKTCINAGITCDAKA
ncbi:MAG TPA: DUF1996 domain-containing protein [Acidimicrobiia bacterium]|jgi:hypothetical protein